MPTKFGDIMAHLEAEGITVANDKKERGRIAAFISAVLSLQVSITGRAGVYIPAFDDERPDVEAPIEQTVNYD